MRTRQRLVLIGAAMAIFAATAPARARGFGTSQPIIPGGPSGTYAVQGRISIATDGASLWVAAWTRRLDTGLPSGQHRYQLYTARSTDGGLTWLAPTLVSDWLSHIFIDEATMAVAHHGTGAFVLAWPAFTGGIGVVDILVSRSTDGAGSWSVPVPLAPDAASDPWANQSVGLASDGAGTVIAWWARGDGTHPDPVVASHSTNGGLTWTTPTELFQHSLDVVQIVAHAPGVFSAMPIGAAQSWIRRSIDGGATWSAPLYHGLNQLGAFAADGNTLVAAFGVGPTPPIFRSTDDGATWTPVATLPASVWFTDFGAHMASNGAGILTLVLATYHPDDDLDIVSLRSDDGGLTWESPALVDTRALSDHTDSDDHPVIALNAGQGLVAWWSDHDPTTPWIARLLPDARCPTTPLAGCRLPTVPGAAKISLRDNTNDAADKLDWKWMRGAATTVEDLGDPTTTTSYVLCSYDASSTLVGEVRMRGGVCGRSLCWKEAGSQLKLKDGERLPDGVSTALLRAGTAGAASVKLKAKGTLLPEPSLPFALPLRVQLQASNGTCWEAAYSTSIQNDPTGFKAASD